MPAASERPENAGPDSQDNRQKRQTTVRKSERADTEHNRTDNQRRKYKQKQSMAASMGDFHEMVSQRIIARHVQEVSTGRIALS